MKIILMGTGPFAVPTFEAIRARGDHIVLVITRPVRGGKSRGGPPPTPVRDWAIQHALPVEAPESINDPAAVARLHEFGPDLLVVCDYGQILSSDALATSRLGGINLHGSLLPKYRGAAPVQWSVLNGDDVAGVSVLHMTARLDGGPILSLAKTEIGATETAGELENRLSALGVDPTLDAIDKLKSWDGSSEIGERQNPDEITKAPRLAKSDGAIDWGRDAAEIDCHVRGMLPWPVAYTMFKPKTDKPPLRVAIGKVRLTDQSVGDHASGELRFDDRLLVACGDRWIEVLEVQPAGKRAMSGTDFMRGHQPPQGSRFFE